jgi:hypothetical protein
LSGDNVDSGTFATIFWLIGAASYGLRVAAWSTHPDRDMHFMAGVALVSASFVVWVILSTVECGISAHRTLVNMAERPAW